MRDSPPLTARAAAAGAPSASAAATPRRAPIYGSAGAARPSPP